MIYLDSAATTLQKPPQVFAAMEHAMRNFSSPGRGGHAAAMGAAEAVYACREEAAELFSCEPEQVVFTMNATHGLNIAIKSLVGFGEKVVVSGFEHNAVVRPLYAIGAKICIVGREVFSPQNLLQEFDRAIDSETRAVICTHVSNVFGFILPIAEIAELCRKKHVPFIVDASQSAGVLPVQLSKLGAAFIAFPGHKSLYGPQGTGILLCGRLPKPLMEGGSGSFSESRQMPDFLPERAEAGTPNTTGICALAAGIRFVRERGINNIFRHECTLRERLAQKLRQNPRLRLFSSRQVQSGVLSFQIQGLDCELAAQRLDDAGFAV
ncbi:MAG: aminotransferase class V-fold PLP-dependent enzyme, partial [Oscillospiraceae bacterium]|nr:aminotransferase class V-fold PLP-dependent enzyme [Oscillospiraceae bacterium]